MKPHAVYELRRYRLHPGGRERLIDLFDREFVDPQEALGMRVEGEFRDCGDPDAFVWVRSFADMETRTEALAAFYSGPVWKEHGSLANETMLNSDNVLLLKPVAGTQPFARNLAREKQARSTKGLVTVNICSLAPGTEDRFAAFFIAEALPIFEEAGARIDAVFVTERSANAFPRLPVRQGDTVLAWFEMHEDEDGLSRHQERLSNDVRWTNEVFPRMDSQCWRRIEVSRLTPTSRSLCTL
ncbi:NIPSNAP family protein (plasmid) [Ensifer sp. PDNC004]|uniref:NIPSNAP family protein n=1 Tax=Ensifer sp. PDNC004 TaxID=2811423 RepID=UPI00196663A1|nr:NIPSNAP family protein [Ensifer sp. PDNC004]QRY65646.1 NIPSNAP family protein [Ensifer sp. PDNC004]